MNPASKKNIEEANSFKKRFKVRFQSIKEFLSEFAILG